jgi:hypothetical protein
MDKFYSIGILVLVLLIAAMSALFCYVVDPYGIYHQPNLNDRQASQVNLLPYLRLSKAYQLEKIQPELLVLGSSRTANLIPSSRLDGSQGYNASLPGMTLYEIKQHLKHAVVYNKPKKVIIALDYPSFLDQANRFQIGYLESRLAETQDDLKIVNRIKRHYRDFYSTLLTSSAIFDSIRALYEVKQGGLTFYSDGTWSATVGVDHETRKSRFLLIAAQYYRSAIKASTQLDLGVLEEIVRYCYQQQIDASFYISPTHYLMINAYQEAGQLSSFYLWHREVLDVLTTQAQTADQPPFPLFAFQNDFRAVGEDILSPSIDGYFFSDVMHFNFAYGDIIRDAILNRPKDDSQQEHSHIELNQDNLNQYISDVDTNLQRFGQSHSQIISLFNEKANVAK